MALLQDDKAIFYHPLDDAVETIKAKTWTLVTKAPTFAAGKIGSAMFPTADTELTYGTEASFLTGGAAQNISCIKLTSTQVVIVYQDLGDSQRGKVKLATISGSNVTIAGPTTFLTSTLGTSSAAPLTSTKYIIGFTDDGDTRAKVIVGELSGSDSTFGSAVDVNTSNGGSPSIAALDSTTAVIGYRDGGDSNHGTAKVVTVSGLDATVGPEKEFHSSGLSGSEINLTALDSSKFVVAYRSDSNSGLGIVGTVSGTDITFGSTASFATSIGGGTADVERLTAAKVVVCYRDGADSGHGTAKVGTVSGADITWGAEVEFVSANAVDRIEVTAMNSSRFVVAYRDEGDGDNGTSQIGTVSGTGITFGSQVEFQSASTFQLNLVAVSSSAVLVAYRDGSGGSTRVGEASVAGDLSGLTADYDSAAAATKVAFVGWLQNPSA